MFYQLLQYGHFPVMASVATDQQILAKKYPPIYFLPNFSKMLCFLKHHLEFKFNQKVILKLLSSLVSITTNLEATKDKSFYFFYDEVGIKNIFVNAISVKLAKWSCWECELPCQRSAAGGAMLGTGPQAGTTHRSSEKTGPPQTSTLVLRHRPSPANTDITGWTGSK